MSDERQWLDELAAAMGVSPITDAERDQLLDLASVAAHLSVRTAAPISCWLAGRSSLSPSEALELVRALAERLAETDPSTDGGDRPESEVPR